jgi:phage protein D
MADPIGAPQRKEGLPSVDYYAPAFKVEVEGKELDPESKGDVLEVKVVMEMDHLTNFELSINNWDDENFDFKYSDTDQFDVGKRVHVMLGYADQLVSMVAGKITTLTPRFPESGPPTLGVAGHDDRLTLRDRKPVDGDARKYVNMADWEIVQEIAKRNNLRYQATQEGEKHDLVMQKNQDDLQFVMERAKRIDYDCFVRTDPDSGVATLHFEKPTDTRDGKKTRVYQFKWGESLIHFNPTLTVAQQVGKVTVRGWDPKTKSVIVGTATAADLPGASGNGDSGPEVAEDKLGAKQDVVIDSHVTSQQEARDLAIAMLRDRAYEFITAGGQVIGLADLRPGDNVEIDGVGKRFKGSYYVKKVEHTFGTSGYMTVFEARKVYDGGVK